MSQTLVNLKNVAFSFTHKTCFSNVSLDITRGQRIMVIGDNGCGKTLLIQIINRLLQPTEGQVLLANGVKITHVPQANIHGTLSGGEAFNQALSKALKENPDLLLLDEPTNHLDNHNRKSLIRMLKTWPHAFVIATHDVQLLRELSATLWHVSDGCVFEIRRRYDEYQQELMTKKVSIEREIGEIEKQQRKAHQALMQEQTRAKNSRLLGKKSIEQRKWPTIVSSAKLGRSQVTTGNKKAALLQKRCDLSEKRKALRLKEELNPQFYFKTQHTAHKNLVSISDGALGYGQNTLIKDINLTINFGDRIAVLGRNGSGKSSLFKALLGENQVCKSGHWRFSKREELGYLTQNYHELLPEFSAQQMIERIRPEWGYQEIRLHLNRFLFRKNEEVNTKTIFLSGGEKARLSLCLLAASTPSLLLLDEITNNIDLSTRNHILEVLIAYQGGLLVISHDEDFLAQLNIDRSYIIENGRWSEAYIRK